MTWTSKTKEKIPLIILTGPTAVGKTGLSIALAKRLNGEIISADSMQVYRGMDIGTAKIRPFEMQGVPHHLINILDPTEAFDVVQFHKRAKEAVYCIHGRGHLPIVVGGTGFYIQALLYDIDFKDEPEEEESQEEQSVRTRLELQASTEEGYLALVEELSMADPRTLEIVHPNNRKRVIRALEFYIKHGVPISEHNLEERKKESAYCSRYFVLTDDRARLYSRIEQRIDQMLAEGLVDEVKHLMSEGLSRKHISMQGIGYKEIMDYLEGVLDYDTAVDTLKKNTRHFAKRQLTWFRRERDVIWLDRTVLPDDEAVLEEILRHLDF